LLSLHSQQMTNGILNPIAGGDRQYRATRFLGQVTKITLKSFPFLARGVLDDRQRVNANAVRRTCTTLNPGCFKTLGYRRIPEERLTGNVMRARQAVGHKHNP
jgi:hypothetical protein